MLLKYLKCHILAWKSIRMESIVRCVVQVLAACATIGNISVLISRSLAFFFTPLSFHILGNLAVAVLAIERHLLMSFSHPLLCVISEPFMSRYVFRALSIIITFVLVLFKCNPYCCWRCEAYSWSTGVLFSRSGRLRCCRHTVLSVVRHLSWYICCIYLTSCWYDVSLTHPACKRSGLPIFIGIFQ